MEAGILLIFGRIPAFIFGVAGRWFRQERCAEAYVRVFFKSVFYYKLYKFSIHWINECIFA